MATAGESTGQTTSGTAGTGFGDTNGGLGSSSATSATGGGVSGTSQGTRSSTIGTGSSTGTSSSSGGSSSVGGSSTGQSVGTTAATSATGGGSTGSTTGAVGTSTTGTSTTGGGTTGGPICNPTAPPEEFLSCTGPRDCGCPLLCVNDPLSGFSGVCEYPCLQLGDCPNLLTVCKGTSCQLNGCGSGTSNGAFNSFCTVVSGNDGTCQPLSVDAGVVGLCQQGGAATQACNATADRHNLPEACVAGMICIGGGIGSGGVCGDACNPNGPNSCPAGQTCAATVDNPFAGACF